jgi:hypothetical protein
MKRIVLLSSLFTLVLFLTSCTKSVISPTPERLDGTWIIESSARSDGFGWQYFNSGLENGDFDLYQDGAATYQDNFRNMSGQWRINTRYGDYYDENGRFRSGRHTSFELYVRDRYTGSSIDMYFDHAVVYSNQIIVTQYDGYYVTRYVFRRI